MGDLASLDLRTAPIAVLREARGWRSPTRDFWADEAAMWERYTARWQGLDEAAWLAPLAKSDAGGPDWTYLDHVAHLAAWAEIGAQYIARAAAGAGWPKDEDFAGGDFDRFNEDQRAGWMGRTPAQVEARATRAHQDVLAEARALPLEIIRSDDAWGWVFMVLHGHQLDHLGLIEPWLASRAGA
jgi:hypothetical protein